MLIKWRYNRITSPNFANTASSWIPKEIVAQGCAIGNPIAVNPFCNQYVSPNCKMLFVMIIFNASIKTVGGTSICVLFSRENCMMWWNTVSVRIFYYMEVVSQINRWAFDGNSCLLSSFFNVNEFWKYDFYIRARGCSHSVMSQHKWCRRFMKYDMTGRVFRKTLCTIKRRYKKPHGSWFDFRSIHKNFHSSLISTSK